MNIVYASDDNYVEIMAVSICSLLENNKDSFEIVIYILSDHINNENKKKLSALVYKYRRKIFFIETESIEKKLQRQISHDRSLATYSRLFLSTALPESIDKVIYMDCDSLIMGSLDEEYNNYLNDYCIGGVLDIVPEIYKRSIGIDDGIYINAGFLIINLYQWRNKNVEEKFIKCIEQFNGNVPHHDQGIINYVLHNSIKILPPYYNVITPLYELDYKILVNIYHLQNYYSKKEIESALRYPRFAHLVTSCSGRPWENNNLHPLKTQYEYYKAMTEWKDSRLRAAGNNKNVRIMKWIYRKMPQFIFIVVQKIIIYGKNRRETVKLNS